MTSLGFAAYTLGLETPDFVRLPTSQHLLKMVLERARSDTVAYKYSFNLTHEIHYKSSEFLHFAQDVSVAAGGVVWPEGGV